MCAYLPACCLQLCAVLLCTCCVQLPGCLDHITQQQHLALSVALQDSQEQALSAKHAPGLCMQQCSAATAQCMTRVPWPEAAPAVGLLASTTRTQELRALQGLDRKETYGRCAVLC